MAKTKMSPAMKQAFVNVSEKIQEQDEEQQRQVQKKDAAAERFRSSFVINSSMWQDFAAINKTLGVTNNSSLNLLIARFVQENRQYLEFKK